jgi:hypothetical protein
MNKSDINMGESHNNSKDFAYGKDVYEGHIHFFHTLKRGETQLQVDGKLPGKF